MLAPDDEAPTSREQVVGSSHSCFRDADRKGFSDFLPASPDPRGRLGKEIIMTYKFDEDDEEDD